MLHNFRAAIKINGNWETTNKTVCSIEEKPSTTKECCACDHAKYRVNNMLYLCRKTENY